jgi:hypothetical protein
MARPKKEKKEIEEVLVADTVTSGPAEVIEIDIPTMIVPLSVDYPSEGLNNMARTINELVRKVNGL